MWKAGNSIAEIKRQTTIPRTTIKRWIEAKSSRTQRKGKSTRRRFVSKRQIRQIIRYIAKNWSTRRLSLEQVRAHLNIEASARTIRRELRRVGYRRCIACPRPFISRKQAKKRLDFAFRTAGGGQPIGQRLEKEEEIGERLFGVTTVYSSLERLDEFGLLEESMKSGVPIVLSRYIDQGEYRL